jgi:hypothetical protein
VLGRGVGGLVEIVRGSLGRVVCVYMLGLGGAVQLGERRGVQPTRDRRICIIMHLIRLCHVVTAPWSRRQGLARIKAAASSRRAEETQSVCGRV